MQESGHNGINPVLSWRRWDDFCNKPHTDDNSVWNIRRYATAQCFSLVLNNCFRGRFWTYDASQLQCLQLILRQKKKRDDVNCSSVNNSRNDVMAGVYGHPHERIRFPRHSCHFCSTIPELSGCHGSSSACEMAHAEKKSPFWYSISDKKHLNPKLTNLLSDENVKVDVADEDFDEEKEQVKVEEEPLLDENGEVIEKKRHSYIIAKPRPSIVSIGSIAMSVGGNLHKLHTEKETKLSKWYVFT